MSAGYYDIWVRRPEWNEHSVSEQKFFSSYSDAQAYCDYLVKYEAYIDAYCLYNNNMTEQYFKNNPEAKKYFR